MSFIGIKATDIEREAFIKELWKEGRIEVVAISAEAAAGVPERIQKKLKDQGVLCVYPNDNGLDCSNIWKAARHIRNGYAFPTSQVNEYMGNLYQQLAFLTRIGSSLIHNLKIINIYVNSYHTKMNAKPSTVFEAGFGVDHLGQMLYCWMHDIRYSGATIDTGPILSQEALEKCLRSLSFTPDLMTGMVEYETSLAKSKNPDQHDLVFSHVVLEHVKDPRGFLLKAYELTAPNGYFISGIDLSGHSYGNTPWDFMTLSDDEFKKKCTDLTNRWKCDEWKDAMEAVGFSVECRVFSRMDVPASVKAMYPNKDITPGYVQFYCHKVSK